MAVDDDDINDDDTHGYIQAVAIQATASATLHEFLLEIVFANDFALHADPQGDFARMRKELLDLIQYKMTMRDDPGDVSLLVQEETVKMAERFFDKGSAKLTNILQLKARAKNK